MLKTLETLVGLLFLQKSWESGSRGRESDTQQLVFIRSFLNSFKNVIFIKKLTFIQKLYSHSITFQFVYTGMEEQSRDRIILTDNNRRKAAHVSCSVHTKTRNKLKYVETTWNQLEQARTTLNELEPPGTRWNHLERDRLSKELTEKTRNS